MFFCSCHGGVTLATRFPAAAIGVVCLDLWSRYIHVGLLQLLTVQLSLIHDQYFIALLNTKVFFSDIFTSTDRRFRSRRAVNER